ncbi:probable cytochrome P450 6a20 [Chironomus tepperi]|uniref:probable cytochrome P450 6a20 n=1 Tax=Chironomus tepperi TaxID=113505 RepID=UPI00391F2F5A
MLIFIILLAFIIYIWLKSRFQFFERLGFPFVEPKIPFGSLGNVGQTEHMSDFLRREYERFKDKSPAFGIFMLTKPCLVPTNIELIKDILVKHFDNFHQHGIDIDFRNDPLVNNLFFIDGQAWKDLRAKLSPTFTTGKMKLMFPIVSDIADGMIEYLLPHANGRKVLEMSEVYSSFTTEVIANVAFGLDIKCQGNPNNEFRRMAMDVFHPSGWENVKAIFRNSFPSVAAKLGMGFNTQRTIDFFTNIVRDNLEYREKNNIQRNDFFQLLINLKNKDGSLTFEEIAANSYEFFVAGHETSSSVMIFCTYELALHQDVQDRLRAEIEEVLEKHDGDVTYDAIMEMKYLDMVFNETARKHPVIDNQLRRSTRDYKIPNTNLVIPAGTQIIIPVIGLNYDTKYYDNPDEFDPERFTEENVKKRHPFAFIPFSEGPRICIGLRFGTMQAKLGLVKLLKNFKILTSDKTPYPMKYSPTAPFQSPDGGLWLKVERL